MYHVGKLESIDLVYRGTYFGPVPYPPLSTKMAIDKGPRDTWVLPNVMKVWNTAEMFTHSGTAIIGSYIAYRFTEL